MGLHPEKEKREEDGGFLDGYCVAVSVRVDSDPVWKVQGDRSSCQLYITEVVTAGQVW